VHVLRWKAQEHCGEGIPDEACLIELGWYTCQRAKLRARIKPTALCSALDKENSIEFPLDFATLYIQLLLCVSS